MKTSALLSFFASLLAVNLTVACGGADGGSIPSESSAQTSTSPTAPASSGSSATPVKTPAPTSQTSPAASASGPAPSSSAPASVPPVAPAPSTTGTAPADPAAPPVTTPPGTTPPATPPPPAPTTTPPATPPPATDPAVCEDQCLAPKPMIQALFTCSDKCADTDNACFDACWTSSGCAAAPNDQCDADFTACDTQCGVTDTTP